MSMLRRQWDVIWRLAGGVSLRVKIMGLALAMIALLGLGLAVQVRVTMARALTEEIERQGASIALNLAARSANMILANDLDSLQELTQNTVLNNEDVQYAFIINAYGEILSHSFDGNVPPNLLKANNVSLNQRYHVETLQIGDGSIQDVAAPIFEGHSGTVRIGLSQNRLSYTLTDVTRQILLTTLLVSLLGIVISIALTWVFTQPLLALARATRRVVEEDLSYRLTPWADDEVGQLQALFNTMVEHLAHSRQKMEDYNRRLLRRNRELGALNTIAHIVAAPLGPTEVLEYALEQVMDIVHTTGGWVCMLKDDGSCEVCISAGDPSRPDIDLACCQECPTCRKAAQGHRPLVIAPLHPACPLRAISDSDGHTPPGGHVAVPLLVKEEVVGLLNLIYTKENGFETKDLDLLEAVGRQLGIAIENARLWEELKCREALREQLLHKVITVQEEERRRIARELHDEAGQALTSLLIGLRAMEKSANLKQVLTLTADLKDVVAQTLDQVHDLSLELRPSVLDDLGLVPALMRYIQSCPTRFGFHADFVTAGMNNQRLPMEVETTLYRIAQEALTNVARHTGASYVSVLLQQRKGTVILVVEDDGEGFDVVQTMDSPQERDRLGLYGMEERALLVGGRLVVESSPDAGTTISVEIPLEGTWATKQI